MRYNRRGLTLAEMMVVILLIGLVATAVVPGLNSIFAVKQQAAVKDIARSYVWMLETAPIQNCSYRISFNLDRNTWKVEQFPADATVFASPEALEEHKKEKERWKKRGSKKAREEREQEEEQEKGEEPESSMLKTSGQLEDGIVFDFVYTPQYAEEGLQPHSEPPDDPKEDRIAYSWVFPDGSAEHTVIRIIDADDSADGYTLEIEPINGKISISDEIISPKQSMAWLPEEGPSLQ